MPTPCDAASRMLLKVMRGVRGSALASFTAVHKISTRSEELRTLDRLRHRIASDENAE
jgi:hypothetical protein